ncbi:MAG TPA: CpaF family protein [Dehalococcoidia bacterium]|nr:CpaF family protein [Dehalococcoidia bacterium]
MSLWQSVAPAQRARDEDDEILETLHQRIIRAVHESNMQGVDKAQARSLVEQATRRLLSDEFPGVVGDRKEDIIAAVVDEVTGLGPIEKLVRDSSVSEVMVNGPDEVYFERDGIIYESDVRFRDTNHVMRVIERIITAIGRHIDEASPMVDARLEDGSRVNVIIPPLVPRSPVLTIRKFRQDRFSMEELIQAGTLSADMATFLEGCVRAKLNLVVSGGTGTGKTTLLNALSRYIPGRERIVTIEDPLEMRLQQRHVISMEARPPSVEGTGEVTQRMLLRNALRMRPDRIIIGEVRGPEAFDMMQAMNTGHEGSMTTVHANSPRDALARIENMVLMAGFELPVLVIREQMASALHLIIHLSRLFDGTRRITHVTEVSGMEGNIITLQDIFVFQQEGITPDGRVIGELKPTGLRPHFTDRLKAFGVDLVDNVFGVERWA